MKESFMNGFLEKYCVALNISFKEYDAYLDLDSEEKYEILCSLRDLKRAKDDENTILIQLTPDELCHPEGWNPAPS